MEPRSKFEATLPLLSQLQGFGAVSNVTGAFAERTLAVQSSNTDTAVESTAPSRGRGGGKDMK